MNTNPASDVKPDSVQKPDSIPKPDSIVASVRPVVTVVPSDSIVASVVASFKQRSEIGIKKYGVTLDRTDLGLLDWVQHTQEELMDAVLYLEKLKKTLSLTQNEGSSLQCSTIHGGCCCNAVSKTQNNVQ
jgi:hypothetical protein